MGGRVKVNNREKTMRIICLSENYHHYLYDVRTAREPSVPNLGV